MIVTKKTFLLLCTLVAIVLVAGCSITGTDMFGRTPNYFYSHPPASPPYKIPGNACGLYYENITVLDKTTEIIAETFSSRTSYVIVADDNIPREAVSFAVYRQLIPNNTYTVVSTDHQGCGYADHHVWVGGVM